jgi:hypothetical protein
MPLRSQHENDVRTESHDQGFSEMLLRHNTLLCATSATYVGADATTAASERKGQSWLSTIIFAGMISLD